MSMMLREPVANTTPNLGDKIEVALLSQVSKIADQVCDGDWALCDCFLAFLRESQGHFHETGQANAELRCASNAA
jgi:hypothetical protein